MATVKANAYGHGAHEVSLAALAAGADQLGVAMAEEAMALRQFGIAAPIMIFGALPPRAANAIVEQGITATVASVDDVRLLDQVGRINDKPARVHVKVDTGMGRLGVRDEAEMLAVLTAIEDSSYVQLEGMFTHLSSADEMQTEAGFSYTRMQRDRFLAALATARRAGFHVPIAHLANSAGLLWDASFHFDMVRPGIALYGYHPAPDWDTPVELLPVLELRSVITRIASMSRGEAISYGRLYRTDASERIATVALGYADGVPRALANKGYVEVNGVPAPMVGKVCMDQLMVNVTDMEARVGDEVVVYSADLASKASLARHAEVMGTIPYELLCGIGGRVPRECHPKLDVGLHDAL